LRRPRTLEKRGERIVEPAEGLLLGGERVHALPARVSLTDVPELRRLHSVRYLCLPHAPRLAALLKRGVVQVAMVAQQLDRSALLRARRVGAEHVGSPHQHHFSAISVGHGPGGCSFTGPFAYQPYGPVLTFPGKHSERRERGITSSPKAGPPAAHP